MFCFLIPIWKKSSFNQSCIIIIRFNFRDLNAQNTQRVSNSIYLGESWGERFDQGERGRDRRSTVWGELLDRRGHRREAREEAQKQWARSSPPGGSSQRNCTTKISPRPFPLFQFLRIRSDQNPNLVSVWLWSEAIEVEEKRVKIEEEEETSVWVSSWFQMHAG